MKPLSDAAGDSWVDLFLLPDRGEYSYFRLAPEAMSAAPNWLSTAALAVDMSMLSYMRWGDNSMPGEDFRNILRGFRVQILRSGDSTGTAGFFASTPDLAFLVFRGTEHDDFRDLLTDSAFLQVPEPHEPSLLRSIRFQGMRVHLGFQRALDSVWDEVATLLADYREVHQRAPICFTGHSLGGALASLALSRFPGTGTSLYTFGAPRVGNGPFCEHLVAKADLGLYRFVNGHDMVTHGPPTTFGYLHPPLPMLHIDPTGEIRPAEPPSHSDWSELADFLAALKPIGSNFDRRIPVPPMLLDHKPVRYAAPIWDCLERSMR